MDILYDTYYILKYFCADEIIRIMKNVYNIYFYTTLHLTLFFNLLKYDGIYCKLFKKKIYSYIVPLLICCKYDLVDTRTIH